MAFSDNKFQVDVTRKILADLEAQIKQACEPIIEEAVRAAEKTARERVAAFAVSVARTARLDWHGEQLTVRVDFGKAGI